MDSCTGGITNDRAAPEKTNATSGASVGVERESSSDKRSDTNSANLSMIAMANDGQVNTDIYDTVELTANRKRNAKKHVVLFNEIIQAAHYTAMRQCPLLGVIIIHTICICLLLTVHQMLHLDSGSRI